MYIYICAYFISSLFTSYSDPTSSIWVVLWNCALFRRTKEVFGPSFIHHCICFIQSSCVNIVCVFTFLFIYLFISLYFLYTSFNNPLNLYLNISYSLYIIPYSVFSLFRNCTTYRFSVHFCFYNFSYYSFTILILLCLTVIVLFLQFTRLITNSYYSLSFSIHQYESQ